jgi:hypothetical protein
VAAGVDEVDGMMAEMLGGAVKGRLRSILEKI